MRGMRDREEFRWGVEKEGDGWEAMGGGRVDGEGDAVGGGVGRDEIGMRAEPEKGGCEGRRGHICVVLEAPSEAREDWSGEGVP